MSIEEQLKQEILSQYKSVRAFTTAIGIPYTTLDSVFKRGVQNAGVCTMIKVFNALNLDIESIQCGELRPATSNVSPIRSGEKNYRVVNESEYRIVAAYRVASKEDRDVIDNIVGRYDSTQSGKATG